MAPPHAQTIHDPSASVGLSVRKGYTDVRILTAFSGKLTDENGQEHTEADINPPEVRYVETSFKDAHGSYRVLIVADKL